LLDAATTATFPLSPRSTAISCHARCA